MASLVLSGDTSGTVTLAAPAVAGTQSYTLPTAAPAANGYALTSTTGGTMSWAAAGGSPGGSTTQVQYNSSGAFAGSANMTFDGTSLTVNTVKIGLGAGAVATNTAVGVNALGANTSGVNNTALGNGALASNLGASYSTAIGYFALNASSTGSENTAVGRFALTAATTGSYNTAVGLNTLQSVLTGSQNCGVGYRALSTVTGDSNIGIGYDAGNTLTSGSNNIYIGRSSFPSAATVNNEILITTVPTNAGKGTTTGFISAGAGGMYQGNNSASWSVTSDQRLKKNIVDNNVGLDAIKSIQVRNFEYRLPEEVDPALKESDAIIKPGVQLGVIAQEFQQVFPDCVKRESTGVLSVDSDNLTWYAINAIKQLSTALDAANARIAALEAK